jgi:hypothetical protein
MNFSTMDMYWLVKLDDIKSLLNGFCFGTGMILLVGIMVCSIYIIGEDKKEYIKKSVITAISLSVLILFVSAINTFIPSTKQIAAIIVLPKIINNEQIQSFPNKLLDLSEEWLKELSPTKSDSAK